jgi:tRNA modification GTPase
LNTLAGREKAIVTDIRGTTRDWVSAEIHIPPLAATLIDTAGLDSGLFVGDIDRAAQQKSIERVRRADLILLVLDLSRPSEQLGGDLLHAVAGRRIVTVLNKADRPPRLNVYGLPGPLGSAVRVSAKLGTGIEDLIRAIHQVCNVAEFDVRSAAAFTDRQRHLLEQLRDAGSREQARLSTRELLHGQLTV